MQRSRKAAEKSYYSNLGNEEFVKTALEDLELFNLAKHWLRCDMTAEYKYTRYIKTGEGDKVLKLKDNVGTITNAY